MVQKLFKMVLYGPYSYKTPSFSYAPCFSYYDKSQGIFFFYFFPDGAYYLHSQKKKKIYNSQPKHYLSYQNRVHLYARNSHQQGPQWQYCLPVNTVFNCAPLINTAYISLYSDRPDMYSQLLQSQILGNGRK